MGIFDKVKNFIDNSDEDTIDEDIENVYDDSADDTYSSDSTESSKSFSDFSASSRPSSISSTPNIVDHIVDLRSSSRTPVVLKKLDRYLDVQSVADVLNEKRIVILNLETCPADDSRRIIDFLSGVAYANSGDIKKVAGKAYIITPDSVPLSGDVLEDIESMSEGYFD